MKPSVGRIVLYAVADPTEAGMNNGALVAPAVITRVWSDTCVNLKVLLDGNTDLHVTSVVQMSFPYPTETPESVAPRQWQWPPRVE